MAEVATRATASAVKTTVENTGKAASSTAKSMTHAAKDAARAAKSARRAIERTVDSAAGASADAINNVATSAARASSVVSGTVANAASATFHFVGDLNGDGRCDIEDLRIAKAAIGKAAVGLGAETLDLSKAAIRHPIVKDAAAAALVGGAVAAAIPFVGIPFGAAVGAATVLAPGAAGKIIDKTVNGAARVTDQAMSASKARRKTRPKSKS